MLQTTLRRLAATDATLLPAHKPPGTRGLILAAALKLFAERGFTGASIRDLADGVGIQPASLYAHYPSKEHVLAALCRIGHEEQLRRIRRALQSCGDDPCEQVTAYVRENIGVHTAFPMLAVVANAELHELSPELSAAATGLRQQSVQILTDIVQRGVQHGVFNVPDVSLAVAAIGAMGLGVAYWYTPKHELSARFVAEVYSEYALRILVAPGARKRA